MKRKIETLPLNLVIHLLSNLNRVHPATFLAPNVGLEELQMEFSDEEKRQIERERVVNILRAEGEIEIQQIQDIYKEKYNSDLQLWKGEFVKIESFFIHACKATVTGTKVKINKESKSVVSTALQYFAKPQFSHFFGFAQVDKGVTYRVWKYEVESSLKQGIYSNEIITEQVRKSLQGEAKNKIVGFGPEASLESILENLDQFYGDCGSVVGDELLSQAYKLRQGDKEEVSAFASRLDTQLRKAKGQGAELLQDESAMDRHLRLIFWEGLLEGVKDKARHKKDQAKTFSDLIEAARYGEKEYKSSQSVRIARVNLSNAQEGKQQPPAWLPDVVAAVTREVRDILKTEGAAKQPQGAQSFQYQQPSGYVSPNRSIPTFPVPGTPPPQPISATFRTQVPIPTYSDIFTTGCPRYLSSTGAKVSLSDSSA